MRGELIQPVALRLEQAERRGKLDDAAAALARVEQELQEAVRMVEMDCSRILQALQFGMQGE